MHKTHVTLIIGPPRTGKTLLATALVERLRAQGKRAIDLSGESIDTFKSACAGEPRRARYSDAIEPPYDHIVYTMNGSVPDEMAALTRRADVLVRTSVRE